MKAIATSRPIWFLGCCHGFSYGALLTIGNRLPAILVDAHAGSTIENWAVAASALLLVGTLGRVFSGDMTRLMPRQALKAMSSIALIAPPLSKSGPL
jgi:hypothetical protein